MAKKEESPKIALERVYNIPLRKEFLKVPKYKRAKKAMKAVKDFLIKHMKSENVKLGNFLNVKIWEHGIKNPPHHVKVKAVKYDDGKVVAELESVPVPRENKKVDKKEIKKEVKKDEEHIKKELDRLEKETKVIAERKGEGATAKVEAKPVEKPVEKKVEAKPTEKPAPKEEVKKEAVKADAPAKKPEAKPAPKPAAEKKAE